MDKESVNRARLKKAFTFKALAVMALILGFLGSFVIFLFNAVGMFSGYFNPLAFFGFIIPALVGMVIALPLGLISSWYYQNIIFDMGQEWLKINKR